MFSIDKIEVIADDCVTYDGDQIGIISSDDWEIEMSVTKEDFENGELDDEKQYEIIDNLWDIIQVLNGKGYNVIFWREP